MNLLVNLSVKSILRRGTGSSEILHALNIFYMFNQTAIFWVIRSGPHSVERSYARA